VKSQYASSPLSRIWVPSPGPYLKEDIESGNDALQFSVDSTGSKSHELPEWA
jgi:hypothetical protein